MAEYIDRAVCLSILRAKANMAVLMDAAPYFEKAAQMLEKLPTADVAPVVHGRWVTHYRSGTPVAGGYVSTCCDMWNNRKSDYCPNCGAKMDGGAESG